MNTIKECFEIIIKGNKEKSRLAARQVSKILYSNKDNGKFNDINNIIDNVLTEYFQIKEDWRQKNFVTAFSVVYYLHDTEASPDFLFNWFFQLLQHPNGNIRYAAVRMIGQELGPLTYHIRFPNDIKSKKKQLESEKPEKILLSLFINLQNLLTVVYEPKYKKYKYISSLPTSPYKSIQMLLADMEDMCGKEYMESMDNFIIGFYTDADFPNNFKLTF